MPGAIPHSVLPTVLDYCTLAIQGENDDFHDPLCMYTVPPCDYKRRRHASFKGDGHLRRRDHRHTISTTEHPILALVSINSSSSRDLGASLLSPRLYPLLQAPPVQDSTMLLHTPLLDVRPHDRNQDKPVHYCIASCINIWNEEHAASSLVGSGPSGQGTDRTKLTEANTTSGPTSSFDT